MKTRLKNLDSIILALKPYLPQYLVEHGIDTSNNFSCINPKHSDSSPSMTIRQNQEVAFCFGCGTVCDIFTAASFLEGKPISGKKFIEENITYLANKYGVPIQLEDLTQEEIYEYKTYQAYELAAQLVSDTSFGDYSLFDEEINRRGWDKQKLSNWGIGTVNFEEFKERLRKAGFEPGFLQGIDLDRQNLFNNSNMLFTVYNEEGRPVGFSARNLRFSKEDTDHKRGPKYINTRETGLECAIFKKGERLYGVDIARQISGPLYIFEGQANVITARHQGLLNCCCSMGTSFTDHHVNLLKKLGLFNIIFVFDGDEAGQLAIQKILDHKFSKEKDFNLKLCQLPIGQDPDDFIRNKGFDAFVRLKKFTAFEWRISKFVNESGEELSEDKRREIAETMIPLVVSEKSLIRQEAMAKQIAKMAGYDLSTILSEIKRQRNEKDQEVQTKKKNAVEALLQNVKYHPETAEEAVIECKNILEDINKTVIDEEKETGNVTYFLDLKEKDEKKSGEFSGFFMQPDTLGNIATRLDDDWRKDCLFFIGGSEQAGKSSLLSAIAYEIANDIRNNAMCIYFSIDDAARRIIYKWVCQASNNLDLYLNHVSNPNYWKQQNGFEYIVDLREIAFKELLKLIRDDRLIIKESADGTSINYAESLVKYYKDKYPERNIVLCIDSFHKLTDLSEIQGAERTKRLCNKLKNATTGNHITTIATAEYRKLEHGEKPNNLALAESRALSYDADVILHLYNELHYINEEDAILVHQDKLGNILPRIWCKFGKNKISGYEGREFLDLFPSAAQFRSVDLDSAIKDQKERMRQIKERKKGENE